MGTTMNRRQFLKTGCLTGAAIGVTLCGGTALAATYQPKIELPSRTYGEKTMDKRILIGYASKAGSTAEVAERMGQILAKRGVQADVMPVGKVKDLSGYQGVVVGSAIRMGKLLPEALNFIEKNQAFLGQKTFSMFVVCMTLEKDTPENRTTVSAYLDPARVLVKPASEGFFAGVMNPNKVGLLDRAIIAMLNTPVGDFRKWDQIEAWAQAAPIG
jgi:menaquinone-dependent protoporphyrinogen oxidase